MIGAGSFDRRIDVQRPAESRDAGTNAVIVSWSTHLASVPASIRRASGREFLDADQVQSERRAVFTIRYADVVVTDRVLADDGLTYGISDIREIGRRRFLELQCEAIQ
ncbi:phage head closure protein [Mesorhizobium sp. LHD-90]|uniref:phage head closure protein n=1 Tax=Mesorhizobium sp. LHD-90 TaxID=3071414 RepID=UPI0027DEBD66|nr:phage head closure protein [Mesorhizobium sp. LHD-90]MDQ6434387.1 phage head closure protein [Mesorhizobium sp. LHD-90]